MWGKGRRDTAGVPGAGQSGEEDLCVQTQLASPWRLPDKAVRRVRRVQSGEGSELDLPTPKGPLWSVPVFNSGTMWQQGVTAGQGQWQTVDNL